MGFSEGNLEPDFNENVTDYTLMIHNGKAKQLLVTVQLDTDKYDLLQLPVLKWNGQVMKYSPIETIEFTMPLNESIGPFQRDATLECRDKKDGSIFAPTNSKTYTIHITQVPDVEEIVTAKAITVVDPDDANRPYPATPPYRSQTKENEIIYYVDHKVKRVLVHVECPPEASQLKYNGVAAPGTAADYTTNPIEGASKSVLAQCIYRDQRWTRGKEMQRTYVLKILRNHTLFGTNVSIRVWPPSQGICKTKTTSSGGVSNYNFSCMGYTGSVPLLGTYTEPKAELVIVNTKSGARYRLWNGIPSHVPVGGPYVLHLEAGEHLKEYGFALIHPPYCENIDCAEGTMFRPDVFRWWSHGDTAKKYCKWDPCNIQDDFNHCCGPKGATCDTYELCFDPNYRKAHRDVCPHDDDYKMHGKIIYKQDYTNQTPWSCHGGDDISISRFERCAWTPCRADDNDGQKCCGVAGAASCSTLKCPPDMVPKAAAATTRCASSPCSLDKDTHTCCGFRDICTSMECPAGYSVKYNAALFMCSGEKCSAMDRDECCDSSAYCDSWTCPPLWSPKPKAAIIPCGGYPCMEWDTGLCCNMDGMCSTLNCPVGYYKKEHAETRPCAGIANRTCNLNIDLNRCCQKAAVCSASYVCGASSGYMLKLNAKYMTCPGAECTQDDRNLCCDMTDPFKAATSISVEPASGEGQCTRTDRNDGEYFFDCTATGSSVTTLHLKAKFEFDQPVGNQIYFDTHLISGKTASFPLRDIPVPKEGKKYVLQMHCRVAGRGVATQKVSIYVNGASESGGGGESVLRKLSFGRQLAALVSASSRTSIALAFVAVCLANCAMW
jgi:hypothetical protein